MTSIENVQAPAALRELRQWLIWSLEDNPKGGKKLKMPYYAWSGKRRGKQSTPEDVEQLVDFDAAKAAAAKAAERNGKSWGVGLAMIKGSPVTALDFDRCVTKIEAADGSIVYHVDPAVEELVQGTYAEISPSGTGIRAFVQGNVGNGREAHPEDGGFGLELFNASGFVTFTGNITELCLMTGSERMVSKPTPKLLQHIEERWGAPNIVETKESYEAFSEPQVALSHAEVLEVLSFMSCETYDEWRSVGMALHHQFDGDAEGFCIWDEWSQAGSLYPGSDAVAAKWNSFGNPTGRPLTFAGVVRKAQAAGCAVSINTAELDDFEVLEPLPQAPLTPHGEFGFYTMAELRARVGPPVWLIKGILPKAEIGMLFGASTAGKSFVLMDMCAAIVRGVDWNGRKVAKGRVLYVVAEGRGGFPDRMEAYCRKHNIPEEDVPIVYVGRKAPNLIDTASVKAFIEEVKRFGPFDLIVLDTLAKVTVGADENSGKEMGLALANAEAIGVAAGGMPLLVHHSGKDTSKGSRGHSSLKGNVDVQLEVQRPNDNSPIRTLYVHKVKEAPAQFGLDFKLEVVPVSRVDEDGDQASSCTVDFLQGEPRKAKVPQPKGANECIVLAVAHEMAGLAADARIPQTELIDNSVAQKIHDPSKKDNRKRDMMRAIDTLAAQGWLKIDNGFVQVSEADNAQ